ncbi:N-acetylaspartate synthetase-like [Aulostomus maculatus]
MMEKTLGRGDKHQVGLPPVVVREFEPADRAQVQRIFCEGMKEMVSDTAFRGLRHHPESLLLYSSIAVACFVITMCWWVIALLPVLVLSGRYYYSSHVVRGYLEQARDMEDMEEVYMRPPDSCLWVALLEGKVVGVVAAIRQSGSSGAVELKRMSVDRRFRRRGVGMALGRKVLEFAVNHRYSSVVLGTTAYTPNAHKLYKCLGFHNMGVTNGYVTPGARRSLLERIFYRVSYHHYSLDVKNIKIS